MHRNYTNKGKITTMFIGTDFSYLDFKSPFESTGKESTKRGNERAEAS